MRYLYAVAVTLLYVGGLRLLFALAGVVFLVAGALDYFLFHNQAAGLVAALVGLVTLSCGYMFELWPGDAGMEVRDGGAPPGAEIPEEFPQWADRQAAPLTRRPSVPAITLK